MEREKLISLAERCEAATGADDALLGAMMCAVAGVPFGRTQITTGDDGSPEINVFRGGTFAGTSWVYGGYRDRAPDVSLDAALALTAEKLPGLYMWRIDFDDEPVANPASAEVYGQTYGEASAATPALALMAALLRALAAQAEKEGR